MRDCEAASSTCMYNGLAVGLDDSNGRAFGCASLREKCNFDCGDTTGERCGGVKRRGIVAELVVRGVRGTRSTGAAPTAQLGPQRCGGK